MHVDLGNALAAVATPGIPGDDLAALDDEVADAHTRIRDGVAAGEHGYAALGLPEAVDPSSIADAVEPVADADAVLTVGIGGSALGATTITGALGGRHVALDNVDPRFVQAALDDLPLADTAIHVVSRSGTTAETLANFLVVRDALRDAGIDWTDRTIVTTGDDGPLRALADRHDLPATGVPAGVPGRFAALSPVGLVPAAILGLDVDRLLAGARDEADTLAPSLHDCPAYAYGAAAAALAGEGAVVNACMPYAERLEGFAEWFAQLWAESLGKDGRGQVPARSLGVTDQHSQLQLYRDGPRSLMVTFVHVNDCDVDLPIPALDDPAVDYLADATLGGLLDAEFAATEASLAAADRPSVRVEVDRLDARGLGGLLYGIEAACVLAGELMDVNAFDQPAVEWGKRATRDLLRGADTEAARAAGDKTEFRVEGPT